jgi:hypothetical protein
VARRIFQACPVWIYTQSNITSIIMKKLFIRRVIHVSALKFDYLFFIHTVLYCSLHDFQKSVLRSDNECFN